MTEYSDANGDDLPLKAPTMSVCAKDGLKTELTLNGYRRLQKNYFQNLV